MNPIDRWIVIIHYLIVKVVPYDTALNHHSLAATRKGICTFYLYSILPDRRSVSWRVGEVCFHLKPRHSVNELSCTVRALALALLYQKQGKIII
jgi:hypothetical protein